MATFLEEVAHSFWKQRAFANDAGRLPRLVPKMRSRTQRIAPLARTALFVIDEAHILDGVLGSC